MKLSRSTIARHTAIFVAAACVQQAGLAADTSPGTWRCGNTYSDQPCQGGKALDLDDARQTAQKRDADRTTREAQLAADRMERDRLRLESTQGRRHATLIDNQKPTMASSSSSSNSGSILTKKKSEKKPQHFGAYDPASLTKKAPKAKSNKRAPKD
jgi:hypothetical protein